MRIALLFKSYGPYHLARLRAVRERHTVLAVEFSSFDGDHDWKVDEQKIDAGVISLSHRGSAWGRGNTVAKLSSELLRFAPDAVAIPGYAEPAALAALCLCRKLDIPSVLMSDSHALSIRKRIFREALKRRLLPLAQAAFVGGTPHRRYLADLGFPQDKIVTGYDVIDNRHFRHAVHRRPDVSAGDGALGPPRRYFFCCSRFVKKKNLAFLVEAFAHYRRRAAMSDGWDLVIAGDGPLRQAVSERISELGLEPHVHLSGPKTYSELPFLYGAAGAFILPSLYDEWGLVVNEAMAAGLPVLVSKAAGCSEDLVDDGVNGYAFDPTNVAELSGLMGEIANAPHRTSMGEASRHIISRWGVHRFASGLTEAASMACSSRSPANASLAAAIAAALSYRG